MSELSRRTLVAGAAALPALSVPAVASAAAGPSTTLPPDLIEQFVRMRAWYLDCNGREKRWSDEIDRRFLAATGVTEDDWRDMDHDHPRRKELNEVFSSVIDEAPPKENRSKTECDELCDERWNVAVAMMEHKPQTFADLAWQLEAYLIADLELLHEAADSSTSDQLIRTLFRHIRALGALPQPHDPLGALSLDVYNEDEAEA